MAPISRNSPWEGAWRQRLPATNDDLPHSEGPSTIVADDANQPSISHSGPADWQYPQTYCDARYGDGHRLTAVAFAAAASASDSRSTAWSPPCAALRNLRWVHTAFGRGGVVTPHCSGMGRDIEDERRTVCKRKRPDRGGGITCAVPSAGHARATPRAARQPVPAPASTTAAANPQPDSRRAAPLRA